MAVGLAERERVAGVAEAVHPLVRHLLRLDVGGAGDDRVGLELVVHEGAEALPERPGDSRQDPERRLHLALFDRVHDRRVQPRLLREVGDAPLARLPVAAYPLPDLARLCRLRLHCVAAHLEIPFLVCVCVVFGLCFGDAKSGPPSPGDPLCLGCL